MARHTTEWFRLLLRFAADSLAAQPVRSALTMLGMAIGTASVVAVVSIGLVGREYVVGLIEGVGSNLVFAYGTGDGVNPDEIEFDDIPVFRDRVPAVRAIAPVLVGGDAIYIHGKAQPVSVLGVTPEYYRVRNLLTVHGRFLTSQEETNAAKVCAISKELALRRFGRVDVENESIRLYNLRFRIIGVYREAVGTAATVGQSEAAGLVAMIPYSTLKALSDVRFVDVVYFEAESPELVPVVMDGVTDVLASRHRTMQSFRVESLEQYVAIAKRVSDAVTLGLMGIAAVSLLVAGIGIMNIMMVTVAERTSDIGIRLALGAGRRAVLVQFLLEAAILSLIGGSLGVALGAGIPVYVGLLYRVEVPVSLASVIIAFTVSAAVGLFFGLYPARRAANMNIVDALGYQG
jgi:putative ABC transport system permease protein